MARMDADGFNSRTGGKLLHSAFNCSFAWTRKSGAELADEHSPGWPGRSTRVVVLKSNFALAPRGELAENA